MFLSVFDVFKIGIGPSSSHTMGPMTAANRFLDELKFGDFPRASNTVPTALVASLHGSLAFTGVGHGTDRAVILGLSGESPATVDPNRMDAIISAVIQSGTVSPPGHGTYRFRPAQDLTFDRKSPLPGHPNGLAFTAYDADRQLLLRRSTTRSAAASWSARPSWMQSAPRHPQPRCPTHSRTRRRCCRWRPSLASASRR